MEKKTENKITQLAARQVAKGEQLILFKKIHTWQELESNVGVEILDTFKSLPFNYGNYKLWSKLWKDTAVERANNQQTRLLQEVSKPKLQPAKQTDTIGRITLYPEQQAVYQAIKQAFWQDRSTRIAVNDGIMGSGKTFLAGALIDYVIRNKLWLSDESSAVRYDIPYRILVTTPKTVVESYSRVLEAFGLGKYLGNVILVTSLSQLTSSLGAVFYKEQFDAMGESEDPKLIINPAMIPYLWVADEFHRLNNWNTKQTRLAMAMADLELPPYVLAMSATPWVKVNDSKFVVCASRRKYFGMHITAENFNIFAKELAKRPDKPNIAASKRLREQLAPIIFSFPYVKWKAKAINQVLIVDFEKPEHKQAYESAFETFLERKRKAGDNTKFGRFEEWIALGQFRKAVEPLRVPAMVQRTLADLQNNKAVVLGDCYRKTVIDTVFRLTEAGLSRDQISVIWGGKTAWNKKLLLSDDELQELCNRVMAGEQLDEYEARCMHETLNYKTERLLAAETEDEQRTRIAKQHNLRLYDTQSASQRQEEIDRFQSGQSIVCVFTLAAGGVGLSLDQDKPSLRPRVGYFSPSYSGPEFKQALGRTIRRGTLENVYQYMVYMADTVEEYRVAPAIDTKMKCLSEVTKSTFNIIDLDTCEKIKHRYRSSEQAIQDAESDSAQLQDYDDKYNKDQDDE